MSKFKGEATAMLKPSSSTVATVASALDSVGATWVHMALVTMIAGAVNKKGMFRLEPHEKVVISSENMIQGSAFWYIVLHFLVWGVENHHFNVRGLEDVLDEQGSSNLTKVKHIAENMLARCTLRAPRNRSPEDHYYQGVECDEELEPSDDEEEELDKDDGDEANGDGVGTKDARETTQV